MEINILHIQNTFIYKYKDLLRNKNSKFIVNFSDLLDNTLSRSVLDKNRMLIGSLIVKRLNKIFARDIKDSTKIYYVVTTLDQDTIDNINRIVGKMYDGLIVFNVYTDKKDSNLQNINSFKLEKFYDCR